jgi:hypothetical protein
LSPQIQKGSRMPTHSYCCVGLQHLSEEHSSRWALLPHCHLSLQLLRMQSSTATCTAGGAPVTAAAWSQHCRETSPSSCHCSNTAI